MARTAVPEGQVVVSMGRPETYFQVLTSGTASSSSSIGGGSGGDDGAGSHPASPSLSSGIGGGVGGGVSGGAGEADGTTMHEPGWSFGNMALLYDSEATVTVRAVTHP